jgi:HEAT repeat protein
MTGLEIILAFIISLAANGVSSAYAGLNQAKLKEALEDKEAFSKALASGRTLRDEVRIACNRLAQDRDLLGVGTKEEPLLQLLATDDFQAILTEWLMAGGIEEGDSVKHRLIQVMEQALVAGGASPEQIKFLQTEYFQAIERSVFSSDILAHWRHQLSMDYLRQQVAFLRTKAEEAAGIYSPEKRKAALDQYCEKALKSWDIIDLSNLPEGDVHMATQKLLLRQLYMPLRITIEADGSGADDASLKGLEEQRQTTRRMEAGRLVSDERASLPSTRPSSPVGERLGVSKRLVVLGDPGGGKTTMLRWMATAYLLRHRKDPAFGELPDTGTLPDRNWIPVLIRCRDLGEADLCRCFTDFLAQHLHKTELLPDEAEIMRAVVLESVAKGEALLLVDGLDEITNPRVRVMFCQELERCTARYPDTPVVVTSRIVGYRDMPYRMASGFEHGIIAELSRGDKELFAQRWVEVTEQHQPPEGKQKRVQDLIDALHSSDRIERLTGNPMLLTTLALVKRKVGKLPSKRTKLYAEAVSVLLNWNPRHYQTIEEDEAVPQLEYLAYEMCRRGVQSLTEDEVLELLERVRAEYPNIRAIRSQEPRAFLQLLEARSSILVRCGGLWLRGEAQEKPVWEFRQLTFQEYMAARALHDGRYPARDKSRTLADQVAVLAGLLDQPLGTGKEPQELVVSESWREALRLVVVDCKDDDVDDVLLALATPMPGENAAKTKRARTVLAAQSLADEPNVSEAVARVIIESLVEQTGPDDGDGYFRTSLDKAALELGMSLWAPLLRTCFINGFRSGESAKRRQPGGLWGMVEVSRASRDERDLEAWFSSLPKRIRSVDEIEAIAAALATTVVAFRGQAKLIPGLIEGLLDMLFLSPPSSLAAAWALRWLSDPMVEGDASPVWQPTGNDVQILIEALKHVGSKEIDSLRYLAYCLGTSEDPRAVEPLIRQLEDNDAGVRVSAAEALGELGEKQAVEPLIRLLQDDNASVRMAVARALGELGEKQAVEPLIRQLEDNDASVRGTVAEALGELGEKRAVEPLIRQLEDNDASVRVSVAEALGELGERQAVEPLIRRLQDNDVGVRGTVAEALGELGEKQAVESLIRLLEDNHAGVRGVVAGALGKLGEKQAVEPLIRQLQDDNASVRMTVAGALGRLGEKQAVEPLIRQLQDNDAGVRGSVAEALGNLGDKQAIESLVPGLEDTDPGVCCAAADALAQLNDTRGPAALRRFLQDSLSAKRVAAIEKLAKRRDEIDQRLLSRDLDADAPWFDPQEPIRETLVAKASHRLGISEEEIRTRYASIEADLGLKLGWATTE